MNRSLELYERRAAAFIVDFIIAVMLAWTLNILIFVKMDLPLATVGFFNIMMILPFLTYPLLNGLLTIVFNGKTIGGFVFHLRIVNDDYRLRPARLNPFNAVVRAVLLAVYTVVIVSFFYMLVRKTTVSYFDRVAHTSVISG